MATDQARRGRAVVIGGSMAGLLAARVLADAYGEVLVVDRDTFPGDPQPRGGVPQSRHLHLLLARGSAILEVLFPSLRAQLLAAGAVPVRWPQDVLWLAPQGWGRRTARGLTLTSLSRDLLEHTVRGRLVGDHPNVRLLEDHEVLGLQPSRDGGVAGVRARARSGGADTAVDADLVVDASGRGSHAPEWLVERGYDAPDDTNVNSFLGYASRTYEEPDRATRDWLALFISARAPDGTRGAGLFPIEGGRWHLTVAGVGRDYPPTDEDGFLEFAGSLPTPILGEVIREARPLTRISGYRRTENRLRHFEALRRWPNGFIVLGDAAGCFNPVYGQGMTVAGIGALALRRWLADGRSTDAFQRRLAAELQTPWLLATGEDYRYPTTEGPRPGFATRLGHRYVDRILATGRTDDAVGHEFLRVLHLVAPPAALFGPELVARALRGPRSSGSGGENGTGRPPPRPRRADVLPPAAAIASVALTDGFVPVEDGVRLHYLEAGSGPLVVLLHGFPEFWYSWRLQIPALARAGYRVVAVDLRGYNASDKPRGVGAYAMPILARDIARLIDRLGERSAIVAGHDWGGAVAWQLAMRRPDVVERLIVLNAPHPERFAAGLRSPAQLLRSAYIAFFQLPRIPEAFMRWGDFRSLRRTLATATTRDAFDPDDIERYVDALARPRALTSALNYYRSLPRSLLRPRAAMAGGVKAPTLVVWGDRDPYLGPALAEPNHALVPNLTVARFPAAGHWVHLDEPDLVNERILAFLTRTGASPDGSIASRSREGVPG